MDKMQIIKALLCDEAEGAPAEHSFAVPPRQVIVRSRDAGVLYGTITAAEGANVRLMNARQLWKWKAADGITLVDVATFGVDASGCKFSTASANVTVLNACAIIDVTDAAAKSIEAV